MNFYSLEQADRHFFAIQRQNDQRVQNGIIHCPEYYNITAKSTIPESFDVVVNGEIIDIVWDYKTAMKILAENQEK